ncbi:MAG: hypothetical protein J4469_01635 [Candidatus Aenigmarchaeota archaeon]|nr:hypothetical protein [Candidatus Aenigmarchaeota archaeon]
MLRTKKVSEELLDKETCPRCSSHRVYSSAEEFICLACSYIVIKGK